MDRESQIWCRFAHPLNGRVVGDPEIIHKLRSPGLDALVNRLKHRVLEPDFWPEITSGSPVIRPLGHLWRVYSGAREALEVAPTH